MTVKKSLLLILTIFFMSCAANVNMTNFSNQQHDIKSQSIKTSATNGNIDYLIITTEYFKPLLESLAEWKTQKGVVSKIEILEDIIDNYPGTGVPRRIKNCILDYYTNNNTKWVLLAGDSNHIPPKYIECIEGYPNDGDVVICDSFYGDMDNDWFEVNFDYEAEVYVGRLTANNYDEMYNLVENILNYEKNPVIGDWMTHALFVGDILQFDIDWNGDDMLDYGECDGNRLHNYINSTLLPDNWTSYFLAQTHGIKDTDYYSDAQIGYINFRDAINQGCSIGAVTAHGRPDRISISEWITDYDGDNLFDYTANPWEAGGSAIDQMVWNILFDIYGTEIIEEDKLGMYFLGSCSVGTFDYSDNCVAEYFLKNAAIGCVAGSQVVWGEDQWYERVHGGWFVEGLNFRFWEQLFQYNQPGKALALAKADYASDRLIDPEPIEYPEWGNKTLKQFNLLGDPEIPIWLSIPKQLDVNIDQPYNSNTNTMTLKVTASEKPVQGATITYTEDNTLLWKGETNDNGTIEVPYPQIIVNNKVFTASKNGFIPFQANLSQNGGSDSVPGYDIILVSFTLLGMICIISIHNKVSLSKKN
ncbi:MAG: C25 family cysteine peptidase [Promethearchaeota archaeon]